MALLACFSCRPTLTTTLTIPVNVEVRADTFDLPDMLRDGDSVVSFPCGDEVSCPVVEAAPLACESGACDPEPVEIAAMVGEIDLMAAVEEATLGITSIDSIEILGLERQISRNTLSVETPPSEIFWGPTGATGVDPAMGVRRIASLPAIAVGASATDAADIDAGGTTALREHVEGGAQRFRVFTKSGVDLEPGGAWPAGSIEMTLAIEVRVVSGLT